MIKQKPPNIVSVDPAAIRPDVIRPAVQALKTGGVIMFPTHSLYGLGADALNPQAVLKVFQIKQRPHNKPLLVLADSLARIGKLVRRFPDTAERLVNRFWPGGLTLIFEASNALSPALTGGIGKIGIRMPEHPVAKALCREMDGPVTATSANISGEPAACCVDTATLHHLPGLDLVLDAGPLAGGPGSTVVDITVNPPQILRQGRIPAKEIAQFF